MQLIPVALIAGLFGFLVATLVPQPLPEVKQILLDDGTRCVVLNGKRRAIHCDWKDRSIEKPAYQIDFQRKQEVKS